MKRFLLILIICLYVSPASAAVCTTFVKRVCQPDKPCKTSESYTSFADSPSECIVQSKRFCPVYLTEAVASKQVHVHFDGQPLNQEKSICQ